MRLWTFHPKYLDARGLVALWREALLAQAVLRGRTRGYTRHPQLVRFRLARAPVGCIAEYLKAVHAEGVVRGYAFEAGKIARGGRGKTIAATRGQLDYELSCLLDKLRHRDPKRYDDLNRARRIEPHPLFPIVPGGVEDWEKGAGAARGDRVP